MAITELRKELGLTRIDFARLTGIPLSTLKDWDNGWHQPKDWAVPMIELYARVQYERYKKGEISLKGVE